MVKEAEGASANNKSKFKFFPSHLNISITQPFNFHLHTMCGIKKSFPFATPWHENKLFVFATSTENEERIENVFPSYKRKE